MTFQILHSVVKIEGEIRRSRWQRFLDWLRKRQYVKVYNASACFTIDHSDQGKVLNGDLIILETGVAWLVTIQPYKAIHSAIFDTRMYFNARALTPSPIEDFNSSSQYRGLATVYAHTFKEI